MFCLCCCDDDDEDEDGESSPLVKASSRARPKRIAPPSIAPGSPLPGCSARELAYFLSAYRMRTRGQVSEEEFETIGAQKLLSGFSSDRIFVKDYMTPMAFVLKCAPDTRLVDAVNTMVQQNTSIMLVVEKKQPVGLVTLRGILRKAVASNKGPQTHVGEVMNTELHFIPLDASHTEAVELLHSENTHCLLVMDHEHCLGVATSYDIARMDAEVLQLAIQSSSVYNEPSEEDPQVVVADPAAVYNKSFVKINEDYRLLLHQNSAADLHDADLLHPKATAPKVTNFVRVPVTCELNTPLAKIAELMLTSGNDAVVVVSLTGEAPEGIVTAKDVVLHYVRGIATLACPASVVMQPPVTICTGSSRNQAASLMHRKRVHHLVVVTDAGGLLGLLSSIDIARLDAFKLKRNMLRHGSLSGASTREDSVNSGYVEIGSRVSLTLEATFLDEAVAKD
jgi:CBS domain-containing protein